MFSTQLVNLIPAFIQPGDIIFHQPRQHYYKVLFKTMIKMQDGSWSYGWCYQEMKMTRQNDSVFEQDCNSEIYSRPAEMFDADWKLMLQTL